MINLNLIAGPLGLILCAGLFVFWLLISRKFVGFLYVLSGWALVIAAVHSDGKLSTLISIAIVGGFLTVLLIATYWLVRSRQMAARSKGPRYIPANKK